jgi:flagellar capping protein FliD
MSTTVTALDSTYQTLISSILTVERQPLVSLTTKRDQANVQKSIYSDLKSMLDDLTTSIKALKSSDPFYSLTSGRAAKVTGAPSGSTVFSASASSSAAVGNYQIGVTTLAKEHRVRSDRQDYIDQPLSVNGVPLSGQFILGGLAARSAVATTNSTVAGITTSEVLEGQTELGTDTYSVETRNDPSAGWQFRLVNAAGEAISIRAGDGSYTTGWQSIAENGSHDTGRGLTLSFGGSSADFQALSRLHNAPNAVYSAKGTTIDIAAGDSLVEVASKINAASFADGNMVYASIVDNQLVLSNARQGEGKFIQASDVSGGVLAGLGILSGTDFKNLVQGPSNSSFSVNGMPITRTKNGGLSDVISGVNLDLAADAEGKSASLDVSADFTNDSAAVKAFTDKYNKLISYLSSKIAVSKNSDDTYTRGALSNDYTFVGLRLDLVRQVNQSYTTSGSLQSLTDIGFSLSDTFQLSLSSTAKFEEALKSNRSGVTALLDTVMSSLDTTLSRFTGASGYISTISTSVTDQVKSMNDQIATWNTRLTARQDQLIEQYAAVQTQIEQYTALSTQLSAFWNA